MYAAQRAQTELARSGPPVGLQGPPAASQAHWSPAGRPALGRTCHSEKLLLMAVVMAALWDQLRSGRPCRMRCASRYQLPGSSLLLAQTGRQGQRGVSSSSKLHGAACPKGQSWCSLQLKTAPNHPNICPFAPHIHICCTGKGREQQQQQAPSISPAPRLLGPSRPLLRPSCARPQYHRSHQQLTAALRVRNTAARPVRLAARQHAGQ
jgi:hypothetical protein